jgi:hypothetical protein
MRFIHAGTVLLLAGLCGGCGQRTFHHEQNFTVGDQTVYSADIDAPAKDQSLTVQVKSPGVRLGVFVVLKADKEPLVHRLLNGQPPAGKILAQCPPAEQATLKVTIPAQNAFTVILQNESNKPASVKLTVSETSSH